MRGKRTISLAADSMANGATVDIDTLTEILILPIATGSGGSSASRQPPYDQDDYDEDSNLINDIHGNAIPLGPQSSSVSRQSKAAGSGVRAFDMLCY